MKKNTAVQEPDCCDCAANLGHMEHAEDAHEERGLLWRVWIAGALFCAALLIHRLETGVGEAVPIALFLAAYAVAGYDVLWRAVRNLFRLKVFDENFLMALATVCALVLGDYAEGVAVVLFFRVGEWFEDRAVSRSRRSVAALMDLRPDCANLLRDGAAVRVSPEDVPVDARILVRPGERVPLDGVIVEGSSALDVAALTGEPVPREVAEGDSILSGSVNQSGLLTVRVTTPYSQSTVAKILELMENASAKKSRSERFITRFARYYTPMVVGMALLLAVLPPLLLDQDFGLWVRRALTLLVISCPCALVISIPLSFFGGMGGASRAGILVKGGGALEALSKVRTVVFDKTGTLTRGRFAVSEIVPHKDAGVSAEKLLRLAACAEGHSSHPIARSILAAYGDAPERPSQVEEIPGYGVRAVLDTRDILIGGARWMERNAVPCPALPDDAGTLVHLAVGGAYAGYIRVEDEIRPDAAPALQRLNARTCLLTGDSDAAGRRVADALQIGEVYTQLLPADKVERVEALLARDNGGTLAFVGDGVNDAPVLARADVGIAMGGVGSDAALEAADVVIMTDELSKIADAMRIGRKTMRIVRQNLVFALGVKAVFLALGAAGLAGMWAAVFADVGVSVLAILNACSFSFTEKKKNQKEKA